MEQNCLRREIDSFELIDTVPLPCHLWNSEFEMIYCNDLVLKLHGVSSMEELKEHFMDMSMPRQMDGRTPEESHFENLSIAFEKGRREFNWVHLHADGTPIYCRISLKRMDNQNGTYAISFLRVLSEFDDILREQRESDERIRMMIDSMPLGCVLRDEEFRVLYCNREVTRMFGLSAHSDYEREFANLSPVYQPDGTLSVTKARQLISEARVRGRITFEWLHQDKDGEPIPCEITVVPMPFQNQSASCTFIRDLRELHQTVRVLEHLEKLAYRDGLTGLYNRRFINDAAQSHFVQAREEKTPLSVLMLDIDHFKRVNDEYGHIVGDGVLRMVADVSQKVLAERGILGRFGGEEFVVLMRSDGEEAGRIAEEIRIAIGNDVYTEDGLNIRVTISIGVAQLSEGGVSVTELVGQADEALYQAKQTGRNRVCRYGDA